MLTFEQTLGEEVLPARYLILELAALLDRLDQAAARSSCSPADAPAMRQMIDAVKTLAAPAGEPGRVERLLRHYSGRDI